MQIGIIGLGRMGGNIARRLMKAGHQCVVFDSNASPREELAKLLSAMRLGVGGHIEGQEPIDPERKPAKSSARPRTAAQRAE